MQLHLGCGAHLLAGWINIDQQSPCDQLLDLREPLPFADGSVTAIFARCLIAYFSRAEWRAVLRDWARVLSPTGTIRLVDHAADGHMRQFLAAPDGQRAESASALALWGNEHFGWYKWGITLDTLIADFAGAGLRLLRSASSDPLTLDVEAGRCAS